MGNWRPRTFAEYIAIFWRRKYSILLFTAATAFATLSVAREIPSVYESRAVLGISDQGGKDVGETSSRISAAVQRAVSVSSLAPLTETYRLRSSNESALGAAERLNKDIKIGKQLNDAAPQIPVAISVSYRFKDPKVAQQVVSSIVSTLEQTNDALRSRAAVEADFLDSQIAEVKAGLDEISPPGMTAPVQPIGQSADPEKARQVLLSETDTLADKQYALEQMIGEQNRQILEQRKLVDAARSKSAPSDPAYGALLVRKAEISAQLADYARQYTDKNAKVIQAKAQLAELEGQLAALDSKNRPEGGAVIPAVQELFGLERELIRMQTDLELARREAGRKRASLDILPKANAADPVLPVNPAANLSAKTKIPTAEAVATYDRLVRRFNTLLEQRDKIQAAGFLRAGDAPVFEVIDAPSLPDQPVGPNRKLLYGGALALAFVVGLMVVPITEGRRLFYIHDRSDVAYFLGVPLLAVIPETLTPVERSLKWRYMLVSKVGMVLLAASMPAAVLLARHFNLLQRLVAR